MISQKMFIQQGKSYLKQRFNCPTIDVRQISTIYTNLDNEYKNNVFMIFQSSKEQCDCVMFTPFDLSETGMEKIPEPLEFDWQNARDCLKKHLIENNLEDKGLKPAFHQLDLIAFNEQQATVRFHLNMSEETYLPPNKEKEAILADITNQKHLDKLAVEIPCNTNLDWPERADLIACLNQVLHINNYKNLKEWIEKNPYKWGSPWTEIQALRIMPKILNAIKESDNNNTKWEIEKKDEYVCSAPVLTNAYDPFEELYVHPMELSGVVKVDNLRAIERELHNIKDIEFSVGDMLYKRGVQKQSLDDLLTKLEKLPQKDFDKIKQAQPSGYLESNLAGNLPYYLNYDPLQLKEYGIAHTEENKQLKLQQELVFQYFSCRCFPTQKNKDKYFNFCIENNLKTSFEEAPQRDVVKNAQVAGKVAGKKINKKR